MRDRLLALWAFGRPHTIIGTSLSVCSLAALALLLAPGPASLFPHAIREILPLVCLALLPSLAANIYIVGLNQVTDIEIDRINKPQLPLVSGALSMRSGIVIVVICLILSLLLSMVQGPILTSTVVLSLLIGTAYSLPPFRLKRFPIWAALCIIGVRGMVVNIGFYLHFRAAFRQAGLIAAGPPGIPAEVWALTAFVLLFALAIALFKDIPDREGDRQFNIRTLTVRLGPQLVFQLSLLTVVISYAMPIALLLTGRLPALQPAVLLPTHLLLPLVLLWRSRRVTLSARHQVAAFYQFIWKLFFLEYLLFPLSALPPA